jgi:ribosomal-protein-alanine N-acetyltransferase
MKTPVLETERLLLRPFTKDDASAVFDGWETNPNVSKYMFWKSHSDINKTKAWLDFELDNICKPDWFRWGICLKDSGNLIGTAILYLEESYDKFEVSYNLAESHWRKGYTTEAMERIIDFAKYTLGVTEIVARHAAENTASENVIKKLGFKFVKEISYDCGGELGIVNGKEYLLIL